MSNINKLFGLDCSRWQSNINWDAVAINERNVKFVGIRATISWGYVDSWFGRNWTESKRVGIYRAAYHVLYPGVTAQRQCDHFLKTVGADLGELPLVLDVELSHDSSPMQIRDSVYQCGKYIKEHTGRAPIIYSRASFVDYYMTGVGTPPAWYNDYDWWLAQYLTSGAEHPGPVKLPKGVALQNCIIHQTTGSGPAFGVGSKTLDYNRWQLAPAPSLTEYLIGGIPNEGPCQEAVLELVQAEAHIEKAKSLIKGA